VGEWLRKLYSFRMPSVLFFAKAKTTRPQIFSKRSKGEEGSSPAECYTTARPKRTAQ
jgi:hypothetical protein